MGRLGSPSLGSNGLHDFRVVSLALAQKPVSTTSWLTSSEFWATSGYSGLLFLATLALAFQVGVLGCTFEVVLLGLGLGALWASFEEAFRGM